MSRFKEVCSRLLCVAWMVVVALRLLASINTHAQFVLIDDFEGLSPGAVNGRNGWVSTTGAATVAADPTQPGNQVLRVGPIFNTASIHKPSAIAHPNTGTLFFRMWHGSKINFSMGMTDVFSPNNNFGNYAAQINCNQEGFRNLRVRDGNSFRPVETFFPETWYHVWMVIDTATDSYRVYMQGGPLPVPSLLFAGADSEFKFRNSPGNILRNTDLQNVLIMFGAGDGGHAGPLLIDDIYLDPFGINLDHPLSLAPDTEPPVIVSVEPSPGTVDSLTRITVTFSKPVLGVEAENLQLNGIHAEFLEGMRSAYTFEFEEPPYGLVEITWDANHEIRDYNTPPNRFDETAPESRWEYDLVDMTPPEVVLLNPPAGVTVRQLTQVEVTFSEPVAGITSGALLVNGGPAFGVTAMTDRRYLFTFAEPAPGTVALEWGPGHGITDRAAAPNPFAGGAWFYSLDPDLALSNIRINEFLASNRHGLLDEDGDPEDWIELHNHGTEAISLFGWSLTDDQDDQGQWTFPAIALDPGEYLVVFASGKDRRPTDGGPLHTNFRLSVEGEYLGLYNAELPREVVSEFAPEFPTQRTDHSFGFNSAGQLRYFATPTPGGPNGESAIHEIALEPEFSVERGLFDEPFMVQLSTGTAGGTIRYTLDGSEPTGQSGLNYSEPLQVQGATTLRAVTFNQNALPSRPVTHTYLFLSTVSQQPDNPPGFPATWGAAPNFPGNIVPAHYQMSPEIVNDPAYASRLEEALRSLPAVSIVMDVDDIFGSTRGIYANTRENRNLFRGPEWERACSLEFIPGPGEEAFQVNCGIRIHGNASREPAKTPKHSFRLYFRRDHGPGRLQANLFPDSHVSSFNRLVMRADFNNSWLHWTSSQRTRGTRIRDGWTKESWREMGHHGSHTRYFHLYINGLYWGVYDFGERIDASFAANYFGGRLDDYDVMASKPTRPIDGDQVAYNAMLAAARFTDVTSLNNYLAVHNHLDVTNYIDYMLLNFYAGNDDWGFDSNWNALRKREPAGPFMYFPWDCERVLESATYNRVNSSSVPSGIHTNLVRSAEYRLAFADRVHKHLFNDGALTVPAVTGRWRRHSAQLESAAIAESARWGAYRRDVHPYSGGPYPHYKPDTHWQAEIDRVASSFFPQRHNNFLQQLRNAGLYPNVTPPQLSRHGGTVRADTSITMNAPQGTIYYTMDGQDPRVIGAAAVSPAALPYSGPVPIHQNLTLKARVLHNGEWSALAEADFQLSAPAPHSLGQAGPYLLEEWDPAQPAGSYPPHMIFYQTTQRDPGLEVEMDSAWTLPYDLTSRSRIIGLGADGFAFVNTANAQEAEGAGFLGAALLALDTSGQETIRVSWTAGTVLPNSRIYGIRLQFRVGDSGPFEDVLDAVGNPVEYARNTQAGHSERLSPATLPPSANDQPLVELRWKYYYISGESGPRAHLRLDGIQVTVGDPSAQTLAFVEAPSHGQTSRTLGPVIVQAQGENGILATAFNGTISLSAAAPGALSGATSRQAEGGVAVFDDLMLSQMGPQTLTASSAGLQSASSTLQVVQLTELVMPRYIQGQQPENDNRVPFAYRLTLAGLKPNAAYRYGNRVITSEDPPTQNGAGNMVFVNHTGDFIRNTDAPRFQDGDLNIRHHEFVTDSQGTHTGWFITEPTGNQRFTPGNQVFMRLVLNDGEGGEEEFFFTAPSPVRVIAFGAGDNQGSALFGTSMAAPGSFLLLYDDTAGGDRPLAATVIEATGAEVDGRYAGFYQDRVAGLSGRWGTIMPNGLPGGVQRIEERDLVSGAIQSLISAPGGIRPTFNMNSGSNPTGIQVPGAEAGGFTLWQSRQFTLDELADPDISGPAADPDFDGFQNLVKYGFGLDLFEPGESARPSGELQEANGELYLRFQHRRLIGQNDLEYVIDASENLHEWTVAAGDLLFLESAPAGDGLTEQAIFLIPIGESRQFLRLRVQFREE
jgi:hypothetical protein